MDPIVARKTWRTLEPIHGMIYFAPEAADRYEALGLTGRSGYFASRSAALGPVGAEIVMATFFNFHPDLVRRAVDGVWSRATPGAVLDARLAAAHAALTRNWASIDGEVIAECGQLARRAAEAACDDVGGRPLFAGHAALAWPDDPVLVLWHAQTLLREYRGDGHIAALVADGLTGLQALVVHAASGDVPRAALQATRRWNDEEWAAGVASLAGRGDVDADGGFTERGRERRQWVEDRTDASALKPYATLGEDGCARLRELARPLSRAIVDAGMINVTNAARFLDE